MVSNHLSRIAAPKTWLIKRKGVKWIAKPNPGAHLSRQGMALSVVMRDMLNMAETTKEVKKIIHTKDVFVDKVKRKDEKCCVGLMDIIEFPQSEQQVRILLDVKGRLCAIPVDQKENNTKLSRIEAKTKIRGGKIQLNMIDGRNIIVEKDTYAVGDTLQIGLPKQMIQAHFKLEKNKPIFLIGGKHSGTIAKLEDIHDNRAVFKLGNKRFETLKK